MEHRESRPWIQAHEVGEYAFCARAWWHRRQRHPSSRQEDAERGRRFHVRFARRRQWGDRLLALAPLLLTIGLLAICRALASR